MAPGGDRVTFENYTKGQGYEAKDEDWYFATYGPPEQTRTDVARALEQRRRPRQGHDAGGGDLRRPLAVHPVRRGP